LLIKNYEVAINEISRKNDRRIIFAVVNHAEITKDFPTDITGYNQSK